MADEVSRVYELEVIAKMNERIKKYFENKHGIEYKWCFNCSSWEPYYHEHIVIEDAYKSIKRNHIKRSR